MTPNAPILSISDRSYKHLQKKANDWIPLLSNTEYHTLLSMGQYDLYTFAKEKSSQNLALCGWNHDDGDPNSSSAYLIVELPVFDVPVMH
jgi:hypothetical protein